MVAATQAQSLTITVNGNAWSQNLVSFEIGFQSYQQGTGLILKTGTLVLCNIRGDSRAIDPIDQKDFEVGNIVTVKLPSSVNHPLGNKLRILAPPEVSAINGALPQVEGNLIVSIPVGCNLAYYRTAQSDDDKTGVTLGTAIAINTVIQNLLVAAEVPVADINLSLTSEVQLDFPYSKNGGGFVDMAGELAYSSYYSGTATNPRVLYCNDSNVILNKNIVSPKDESFPLSITIGTNERDYQRQLDLSAGAGIVKASGIKRSLTDLTAEYPFTDTITEQENGLTRTTNITYYYNATAVTSSGLSIFFNNISNINAGSPTAPNIFSANSSFRLDNKTINLFFIEGSYSVVTEPILQFVGFYPSTKQTTTVTSSKNYNYRIFDSKELLRVEIALSLVRLASFYPDDIFDGVIYPNSYTLIDYRNYLVPGEAKVIEYFYDDNKVISKQITSTFQNFFLLDRASQIILEFDEVYGTSPDYRVYARDIVTETWQEQSGRFIYSINTKTAAIVNNPALTSPVEIDERVALQTKTSVQNLRDTEPPATQYWEGTSKITETQITESVTFGNGANPNTIDLQIPFLFNDYDEEPTIASQQAAKFAQIEGEIINGRQFQYLIECQPSIFQSVTAPLAGITVTEPSLKRYFLADALTWYHTPTETYVAFAGIFAGSSAIGGTDPNTFTNLLIASPTPTANLEVAGIAYIDTVTGSAERE